MQDVNIITVSNPLGPSRRKHLPGRHARRTNEVEIKSGWGESKNRFSKELSGLSHKQSGWRNSEAVTMLARLRKKFDAGLSWELKRQLVELMVDGIPSIRSNPAAAAKRDQCPIQVRQFS
jgi:hypothetical protein